jgi:hypothetical protein
LKDYCTLFPDGFKNPFTGEVYYWGGCCAEHDKAFETGDITFMQANDYLWSCAYRKGYRKIANVLWIGTTLFGWPFWLYHRTKKVRI